jgi:hypothetical protein
MDIQTQLNESAAEKSKTPMKILQHNGFIGCIQAGADLSAKGKAIACELMQERNDCR